jgi:hypothetical protein
MSSTGIRASRRPTIRDDFDERRFIALVAPKWGDKAAIFMWKRRQLRHLLGVLVSLIYFVLEMGNIHHPLTWILLFCGANAVLVVGTRMVVNGRIMYREASETLGIRVGKRGQRPPWKSPAYENWCAKNKLIPYAASERFNKGDAISAPLPS